MANRNNCNIYKGLLIGQGKKVKFCGILRAKFTEKSANFTGIFGANFTKK